MQPEVPEEAKRPFRRTLGNISSNEEQMWREVAARMTLDALGFTPEVINVTDGMDKWRYSYYRGTVAKARTWFKSAKDREDRMTVFDLCGVELEPVQRCIASLPPITEPAFLRQARKGGGFKEIRLGA